MTENGYIKSRFIDDKACVAAALAVIKAMKEQGVTPSCNVLFAFPYYEEINHGGAYIPPEVSRVHRFGYRPYRAGLRWKRAEGQHLCKR